MSAPMTVTYYNHNGSFITMNDGNYYVSVNDLRNFTWEYLATNRPSGFGGRVTFSRPVQEKTITVGIRGRTASEFDANAAALMALTEQDIISNKPGKLYLGDQYLTCYLAVSSAVSVYSRRGNFVMKELKIVVTEPFWHTESLYQFLVGAPEAVADPKRYDLRYPYRYIATSSSGTITNLHYADCPMIITVYGAATNPSITIGGNIYSVTASVSAGQRIVINQINRTIVSMAADGSTTNLFDYRDKDNDIFTSLSPGTQTVVYDGAFSFDIIAIQQRSEPTWI